MGGTRSPFDANSGSTVNISGGSVDNEFEAHSGSEVNISGGTVSSGFKASSGSEVNLFGTDFAIDGVLLADLVAGEKFTILDRNAVLSGVFADGSAFSFDLNTDFAFSETEFAPDATLTVTLTSELLLGDVNQDGLVDFSDIPAFISTLISGEYLAEADIDQNGVVDFSDIPGFIATLIAS